MVETEIGDAEIDGPAVSSAKKKRERERGGGGRRTVRARKKRKSLRAKCHTEWCAQIRSSNFYARSNLYYYYFFKGLTVITMINNFDTWDVKLVKCQNLSKNKIISLIILLSLTKFTSSIGGCLKIIKI